MSSTRQVRSADKNRGGMAAPPHSVVQLMKTASYRGQRTMSVREKELASAVLSQGAGRAGANIDTFASWLYAGFGAAIALLLTNHDAQALVPRETVRSCLILFACTTVLVVIEKLLSVIAVGGSESTKVGRELAEKLVKDMKEQGTDEVLNPEIIFEEAQRAAFWPGRTFMARSFEKMKRGDLAAFSRGLFKIVQLQGMLMIAEVGIFLWVITKVILALTVSP